MGYVIAVALLVGAVALLSSPWTRRDPDDFSVVELGYAWRGPRGAVVGALRLLVDVDAVRRSQVRGIARTGKRLPGGLDPIARAVYGGIGVRHHVRAFLSLRGVAERMPAVAGRMVGAGLRVGPVRRVAGTLAALAAPVVAVVAVAHGGGTTGVVVCAVTVAVAGVSLAQRGRTIRGALSGATAPALAAVRLHRGRGLAARRDGTLQSSWAQTSGGDFTTP
jgi:hypothetical protein